MSRAGRGRSEARARLRVFVADNDPDALDLAVTDLTLEGHHIVGTSRTGVGIADYLAANPPDVVVLDHRMPPGPTGLDVARELVARSVPTRIVLYSNYQSPEVVDGARAIGAQFVPKGNLRTLRRALAEEL